jgi:DNA processing protein
MASFAMHHRTADFRALYTRVLADMKDFIGTRNDVLIVASSGTGVMEGSVSNLTSPGDKVLVLTAGKFGERWRDLAKAFGCVVDVLSAPSVAIVGSRAASAYGLSVAGQLAEDLAACGLVVVSGLARGIDSAAHRGALAVNGVTVAVLGSGVDVMYPPEHAALAASIDRDGAVISELVPGTPPQAFFFPQRNRIISGLSRAVVVIEAGEKSGSLITARCALEQGRDVLAVPGNVLSGRNRGAHGLLRDGAKIVESADDILEELGMAHPAASAAEVSKPQGDPLLACLPPGEACNLDVIAERSGLRSSRLLPRLFDLELQGLVRRIGGGRFVRMDRTC